MNYNGNVNNNTRSNTNGVVPVLDHNERNSYSYNDIAVAFMECTRNKRNTYQALEFRSNLLHNLSNLLLDINANTYVPEPCYMFVITHPKPREVWASVFRDRVANHLICQDLVPVLTKRLINTNCACVKGRGTLYAINKAIKFHRKVTNNYDVDAWVLKCDIQNFFVSIDRRKIIDILALEDGRTKRLLDKILNTDITKDAKIHANSISLVPEYKSLLANKYATGIPIGNLLSQILSNYIILHQLDFYVKHILHAKYYVRYVDDFIILGDREYLEQCLAKIKNFLTSINLKLNDKKTELKPIKNGFLFCGRLIKEYRSMCIRRVVRTYLKDPKRNYGLIKHASMFNVRKLFLADKSQD